MNTVRSNNKNFGLHYFKLGIFYFFFFVWFLIAFLTNLINLFNVFDLTHGWSFSSGNYLSLKQVLQIYHTPNVVLNSLFFFDIFIQGLSAALFFLASFFYFKKSTSWPVINSAFVVSIALWAFFLIMEEIFIAYSYEGTHIRLLVLEIVAFLSLHLLPSS